MLFMGGRILVEVHLNYGRSLASRTIQSRVGHLTHDQKPVIVGCRLIANPLPDRVCLSKQLVRVCPADDSHRLRLVRVAGREIAPAQNGDAKCRKETEPDMIFLPMHLRVGEIIAPWT